MPYDFGNEGVAMSGSEGRDYLSFGGIGNGDCSDLRLNKPLQAPRAEVIARLNVGDALTLALEDSDQPVIAVLTGDGKEAGAVIPDQALIDCLRRGVEFRATVRSILGSSVQLTVAAA